jgi:hypothetical protein
MAQESPVGEAAVDEHAQGALGLARIEVECVPQRLHVLGLRRAGEVTHPCFPRMTQAACS